MDTNLDLGTIEHLDFEVDINKNDDDVCHIRQLEVRMDYYCGVPNGFGGHKGKCAEDFSLRIPHGSKFCPHCGVKICPICYEISQFLLRQGL